MSDTSGVTTASGATSTTSSVGSEANATIDVEANATDNEVAIINCFHNFLFLIFLFSSYYPQIKTIRSYTGFILTPYNILCLYKGGIFFEISED